MRLSESGQANQSPQSYAIIERAKRQSREMRDATPGAQAGGWTAGRENLLNFTRHTFLGYQANWHHERLCGFLDRWAEGEIRRLMVFMPPRRGKSELVSRRLPAYILGKYPDTEIAAASYAADLARSLNRDTQRIIDSEEYRQLFPSTQLFGSNIRTTSQGTYLRNSDEFEIVGRRGRYKCAGVGGGLTGRGFLRGIIDDPYKDREQADSATIREKVWDWYTNVFYTRQAPDASILLTMTRWHEDDLAGRLLNGMRGGGDQWEIVSFPEICESTDSPYDVREIGGVLWPSRYSEGDAESIQRAIGIRAWAALYQQRPAPLEGSMFKRQWFADRFMKAAPNETQWVRHWDLAATKDKHAARTAGVKIGKMPDGKFIVGNVVTIQEEGESVRGIIKTTAALDTSSVRISLPQDPGQAGKVQAKDMVAMLAGYVATAEPETGDKATRAEPFAAQCQAGNVYLLEADWNTSYVDELCAFPSGKFKDQVDASSGAFAKLVGAYQWGVA